MILTLLAVSYKDYSIVDHYSRVSRKTEGSASLYVPAGWAFYYSRRLIIKNDSKPRQYGVLIFCNSQRVCVSSIFHVDWN